MTPPPIDEDRNVSGRPIALPETKSNTFVSKRKVTTFEHFLWLILIN